MGLFPKIGNLCDDEPIEYIVFKIKQNTELNEKYRD